MNFDFQGPPITGPLHESPIAEKFEQAILLHLSPDFSIHREFLCPTPWANFRIDIVLKNEEQTTGIECDGKEFHDDFRDETRDSIILGLGLVDTIWRFRGADINFAIHDALFVMSEVEPSVFTARGKEVLSTQACDTVREFEDNSPSRILIPRRNYKEGTEALFPRDLAITRRSRVGVFADTRPFWKTIFEKIKKQPVMPFEELVVQERQELKDWHLK